MIESYTNNIYFEVGCELLDKWAIKTYHSSKVYCIDFNLYNIQKSITFIFEKNCPIQTQNTHYLIFCDGGYLLPIAKYIKSNSLQSIEIIVKEKKNRSGVLLINENVGILGGGRARNALTKSEFELFYSVIIQESMNKYCSRKKIKHKTYYSIRGRILKKMGVNKNMLFLMK
ncbi:hypothetical protein MKleb_5695 (plasmid) [Klebsiella sp. PL-2018]|nr:hypothetical protein MKleb_5695 [Klebsiella sp. PL-2018]